MIKGPPDIIGQRFGEVVVLRYVGIRSVQVTNYRRDLHHWRVKCDCGFTTELPQPKLSKKANCGSSYKHSKTGVVWNPAPHEVPVKALRRVHRKSSHRTLHPVCKAKSRLYSTYQGGAVKRDLEWQLSFEQFCHLITSPCHYSGIPPRNKIDTRGGTFYWNGIDRKDSSKGYTMDNVVPCCTFMNFAKRSTPYDEFVAWVDDFMRYKTGWPRS
jgi:hypothetical protein